MNLEQQINEVADEWDKRVVMEGMMMKESLEYWKNVLRKQHLDLIKNIEEELDNSDNYRKDGTLMRDTFLSKFKDK